MPNRDVHVPVGVAAGAAASFWAAKDEKSYSVLATRALGGAIGGFVGARMPDVFDPSTLGPNHRGLAHGVVPVGAGLCYALQPCCELRDRLLSYGSNNGKAANLLCHFAIGIFEGLIVGYVSHLVLDATTPRGLPVVC